MRLFAVMLALAVTASTQAMAYEPLHQRHARVTRALFDQNASYPAAAK
jgi:hypothetical protein